MKKIGVILGVMILVMGILGGCSSSSAGEELHVVTTLFPQYDFTRQILGDKGNVTLLLPPGTEGHNYEPTPKDVISIYDADVFIYTGEAMEPWSHKLIESLPHDTNVRIVDASAGISLMKEDHEGHDDEHEVDGVSYDPHFWLDPTKAIQMVETIVVELAGVDPANGDYYRANGAKLVAELELLDTDFKEVIEGGKRDTLVFGGRFAYAYFLEHYGLNYVTAYEGCSTEGEPSVKEVKEVIDYMKGNDVHYIYHEEFGNTKICDSIAEETGGTPLLFSTAHNVTREELDNGITFIDIMRRNLENIQKGLE